MGLMTDEQIQSRITSPLNLMNRLRILSDRGEAKPQHPAFPPTIDDVIKDVDDKLANGSIRTKATNILISAMDELEKRMPEIQRPERLASIAADMSKVVDNHNKNTKRGDDDTSPRVIIYAPQIRNENEFVTINVSE